MNKKNLIILAKPYAENLEKRLITRKVGDILLILCRRHTNYIEGVNRQNYSCTEDEMWEAAFRNCVPTVMNPRESFTRKSTVFYPLTMVTEQNFHNFQMLEEFNEGICISCRISACGSVAPFVPGTMERIAKLFNADQLAVLFTSHMEAMVHPVRPDSNLEACHEALIDTNDTFGTPDYFLSNSMYIWDKENGIRIA